MRQFQRLLVLVLVVAAMAALLVTPAFAADPTILQPEPTPLPVVEMPGFNAGEVQLQGAEMPSLTAVRIVVEIPGDIYRNCSSYSSTVTSTCMQRFCTAQGAGEAVQEGGVYRCVNNYTPQSAPKRN
jgi:hypothetical protein